MLTTSSRKVYLGIGIWGSEPIRAIYCPVCGVKLDFYTNLKITETLIIDCICGSNIEITDAYHTE